ncbi:MAG: response regulator [Ancalomicrobiaceae bacterium]|nr:response regulator [Ancalomicrobiaceae bacterium]
MKVHILEDDAGVNESLRTLLQAFGYTVTSHENAASFFLAHPPEADELVIVDLGLPDIDGASVIRWVESLSRPPRVIVISGQPQRLIDRALKDVPNITVLRKPLSGESLMPLLT